MLNRIYRLRIGLHPEQEATTSESVIDGTSGGGGVNPLTDGDLLSTASKEDLEAISVEGLQLRATIPMGKKGASNVQSTNITLINLDPLEFAKIKAESVIILEAGYEDDRDIPVVFAGQIVKATPSYQREDFLVRLVCSGAFTVQKNVRIAKTYPPGNSYQQIIESLILEAEKFGLPLGSFEKTPQEGAKDNTSAFNKLSVKPNSGYQVNGYLMKELGDLCTNLGFRSYVVNGKLYIEPKEYSPNLEVIELSEDLIINEIKPVKDSSSSLSGSTTNKSLIKLTTFLDGRIDPSKKVHILSGEHQGYYDIDSLTHDLDFEGNEWYTTMVLAEVTGD